MFRRHPTARRTPIAALAAALAAAVTLAGCFTGERPTLVSDPAVSSSLPRFTDDENIDAVLTDLDAGIFGQFTADYEILTRFGGKETSVRVVSSPDGRWSATFGDVRFVRDELGDFTCDLAAGTCEDGILPARVSDVGVFPEFYSRDFAARLRTDAQRRVGDSSGYDITQGDLPARCVDVPVSGGTKSYCALDGGPLARYDGPDVFLELVRLDAQVDETAFNLPG